jgi:Signal recognition particle GTPase
MNLAQQPPAVVLMAGLQGAGKTTTVAKLARLLTERKKKKVMVVSCDVYRPARSSNCVRWPSRSA